MKPLTSKAKSMIEDAVWYTYSSAWTSGSATYLQERGITGQSSTGKICTSGILCNDTVNRTTTWTGQVGLMYYSDRAFAGWLYAETWAISPATSSSEAGRVYHGGATTYGPPMVLAGVAMGVWPSVYLKTDVEIIGGDGLNIPYKLSI